MGSLPGSSASELGQSRELADSTRHVRIRPLTARQERNFLEYVEAMFLDIMRNYKKRNHSSTTLPILHSYLRATHILLNLILKIPPVKKQQAALRTALLLRFTSESLSAIPNYPHPALDADENQSGVETLRELLNWLDELDRGWFAVLKSQDWDVVSREGVDWVDASDVMEAEANNWAQIDQEFSPRTLGPANGVSQTDRTRLRSLLLSGSSALEEWLEGIQPPSSTVTSASTSAITTNDTSDSEHDQNMEGQSELSRPDLESTLEKLGFQQAFDDLFSRTLSAMGELGGEMLNAGNELQME